MADITDDLAVLRAMIGGRSGAELAVVTAGRILRVVDECERLQAHVTDLQENGERLLRVVDAYKADADRYRWLRDSDNAPAICDAYADGWFPLVGTGIEATVDAAMQEQPR